MTQDEGFYQIGAGNQGGAANHHDKYDTGGDDFFIFKDPGALEFLKPPPKQYNHRQGQKNDKGGFGVKESKDRSYIGAGDGNIFEIPIAAQDKGSDYTQGR